MWFHGALFQQSLAAHGVPSCPPGLSRTSPPWFCTAVPGAPGAGAGREGPAHLGAPWLWDVGRAQGHRQSSSLFFKDRWFFSKRLNVGGKFVFISILKAGSTYGEGCGWLSWSCIINTRPRSVLHQSFLREPCVTQGSFPWLPEETKHLWYGES